MVTHGEKLLLVWAGLVAAGVAAGWTVQWLRYRLDYLRGWDDGWDERSADMERNAITATLVEEAAGYDLPAHTQVTAAEFDVYRQSHTTYAELSPEALGAIDAKPDHPPSDFSNHCCVHPGTGICMCDCHGDICEPVQRHPDEWGDDTALDAFRQWGTWEEQLAAIDASLGDSPWFAARQREMAA